MTKEAGERTFDELASLLASGDISRLEALKWLGAALLGGALAFTPKVAEAKTVPWCYQVTPVFWTCNESWSKKECEATREADPSALSPKCRRSNVI
jgi:hypothetical protein